MRKIYTGGKPFKKDNKVFIVVSSNEDGLEEFELNSDNCDRFKKHYYNKTGVCLVCGSIYQP